MSGGQGEFDPRRLAFHEGFVGTDLPLAEELEGALEGVPFKIYWGVVRVFRGRPAWTTMRRLAESLQQPDHAYVVKVLAQLEALHLVAYETTARGTWIEVLPCSPQALIALRERAVERLGEGATFSRRATQRLARARAELGLGPAPQPPRPKRRRPSGPQRAALAANAGGAEPARHLVVLEALARRGGREPPPPPSPSTPAQAEPRAADRQAPQPAQLAQAEPLGEEEPASEAPPPSPEPLTDGLPVQPPQASSLPQPTAPETAALTASPEPAPGEPEAPAEALPSPATPASSQPAEAPPLDGSKATDEGQGDQLVSGGAVVASQEPTQASTPGEAPEAGAPGGGELGAGRPEAPQVALLGGGLTPPPGGGLTPPPEGGAPNCSLDPGIQIPPSLPSPTLADAASRPDEGREESSVPSPTEPASQPTAAASPSAQPPAPELLASNRPALEALVVLACSLWPHKLHVSAAERWLRQAIALVEPAPSRAEMAVFLRWAAQEESLAKAAVPLAAAVSPGRFVPWMARRRARLSPPQPPGAAAPPHALHAAREAEVRAAREAADAKRREEKFARATRFADLPPWLRLGVQAAAAPAPQATPGAPVPRPADERAPYERVFAFLSAELRAEGLALLAIPRAEHTDLQRKRFTRLQQMALQAEARRELAEHGATERAVRLAASHDTEQGESSSHRKA